MKEKTIQFKIQEFSSKDELNSLYQNLLNQAADAAHKAYAPYSSFFVGAAILLENNEIITGNNQENAAYPSGLCAERVALFYANAHYPQSKVKAIAITAFINNEIQVSEPIPPCGSCRQVILESQLRQNEPVTLILAGKNKIQVIEDASLLLPLHFDKEMLL
ncbi:MAG TPA: cytidine deaminase [Bacteroidales bacterium]|nr:cytidine deaminase [Bacteroidales bacterium]HNV95470.1 cytidine deaminase [Bacteroidales bacterium]HOU98012.1 cytidine deaminase [Bacteroidales bacterium]